MLNNRRFVLKISGACFADNTGHGVSVEALHRINQEIKTGIMSCPTMELIIVPGGSNLFKGSNAATEFAVGRVTADEIGMLSTIQNGKLLQAHWRSNDYVIQLMSALAIENVTEYNRFQALKLFQERNIVVCVGGMGRALFTTNYAAAYRAAELGANAVFELVEGKSELDSTTKTFCREHKVTWIVAKADPGALAAAIKERVKANGTV